MSCLRGRECHAAHGRHRLAVQKAQRISERCKRRGVRRLPTPLRGGVPEGRGGVKYNRPYVKDEGSSAFNFKENGSFSLKFLHNFQPKDTFIVEEGMFIASQEIVALSG